MSQVQLHASENDEDSNDDGDQDDEQATLRRDIRMLERKVAKYPALLCSIFCNVCWSAYGTVVFVVVCNVLVALGFVLVLPILQIMNAIDLKQRMNTTAATTTMGCPTIEPWLDPILINCVTIIFLALYLIVYAWSIVFVRNRCAGPNVK